MTVLFSVGGSKELATHTKYGVWQIVLTNHEVSYCCKGTEWNCPEDQEVSDHLGNKIHRHPVVAAGSLVSSMGSVKDKKMKQENPARIRPTTSRIEK